MCGWQGGKTALLAIIWSLAVVGSVCIAQPLDLETPVTSPLWWTLTDDVTPAQLRASYRDERAHLERYVEAVRTGLASPITAERAEDLVFYYNSTQNPELTPMWEAWSIFAQAHLVVDGEARIREALSRYPVSALGVDTIVSMGFEQEREERELFQRVREGALAYRDVQKQFLEQQGGLRNPQAIRRLKRLENDGDLRQIAEATGISPAKLTRYRAAFEVNPPTVTAEENLKELKAQLSEEDWEGLRLYLLEVVVPQTGATIEFNIAKEE